MDYKAIAEQLEKIADSDSAVISEWAAVIRTKYLKNAATAITDLLARTEEAEKKRDEEKIKADEYADSARTIAFWLAGFCDRSLSYPQMISNAARKIALAYADMEKRAEAAEARCATLEKMVKKYQEELLPGYRYRAEKAEKCIAEIEDALKFGRYSAAMLRIAEYRRQKEEDQ